MKVSVIIPCYNAASYIRESVISILNQTYKDLEIIICDDSSTDRSYQILTSINDPRIILIKNDRNIGYLRTVNKLFKTTSGSYIAFQDADDISHHFRIESQLQAINLKRLDLVGTNFKIINHRGKVIRSVDKVLEDPDLIKVQLLNSNQFQKPSILFRREILDRVGGYREDFLRLKNISEDYDWLLRIDEAGFRMGNINYKEPLYYYRSVPTAMTKGFNRIEQLFGERIAQYLARQRRTGKPDSIERNDYNDLVEKIAEWKAPYLNDPSKFYIERAAHLMYCGLTFQAIQFSWKACLKSRFSFLSIRTLLYCLRKNIVL